MRRHHVLRASGLLFSFSLGLSAACTGSKGGGTLDADGDGFEVGNDCNDSDASVYPGAPEVCDDGIDQNCDGVDDSCFIDLDGDGFAAPDDCNDNDEFIHPDADELCSDGWDNNCDGISTECLFASLIYSPNTPGGADSYDATVFANHFVFGDVSMGGPMINDGRVVFFDSDTFGELTELEADITSLASPGSDGAYGIILSRPGNMLCIGADYLEYDINNAAAGKSYCFSDATINGAGADLEQIDASYTVSGEQAQDYAVVMDQVDLDGDGYGDLIVRTSRGLHIMDGSATPFAGTYSVPAHANKLLGDCATSTSGWCGFGWAVNHTQPGTLMLSHEGGVADDILLWSLPLSPAQTAADHSADFNRNKDDTAVGIETFAGAAFGNTINDKVVLVDDTGSTIQKISGGGGFGSSTSTVFTQNGHELLMVSNPDALPPHDANGPTSSGIGVVYIFDLTANGLPTHEAEAQWVLIPPEGHHNCGNRAQGGLVSRANGTYTAIASACPGTGGAGYLFDFLPLPAPPVDPADVYAIGKRKYAIREWVVDAYTSNLDWLNGLAQTQAVFDEGVQSGWRLHGIGSASPLARAGLKSGDIIRAVNGADVSDPKVVNTLFASLTESKQIKLFVTRGSKNAVVTYNIVP